MKVQVTFEFNFSPTKTWSAAERQQVANEIYESPLDTLEIMIIDDPLVKVSLDDQPYEDTNDDEDEDDDDEDEE